MGDSESVVAPAMGAEPIRILSPKSGETLTVRFLGDYTGVLVHWHGGRTVACQGSGCHAVAHRKETFWKGYAPVQVWVQEGELWRAAALEVTEGLTRDLPEEGLRGQLWQIRRARSNKKGEPVTGTPLHVDHSAEVPPAFNINQVMCHFFRVNMLATWDAENPIPRAVGVFDSKGSAPPKVGKVRQKPQEGEAGKASKRETAAFSQAIKERLASFSAAKENGQKEAP